MTHVRYIAPLALALVAAGCSKSSSGEGNSLAPTPEAKPAAPAHHEPARPAAAPAPAPTSAPGASMEAPEIPTTKSSPPSVAEWTAAASVNTVGANSAPKDCVMKVVREWLKVNCSGKIKEVTSMEGFGAKNVDYFDSVTPGKSADLVVRVKKGGSIKARILREGGGASLFVNWPGASAKPSILALQIYNG
ncbi:MAG: hypothetical protein IT374_00095 [Polyangiaceae bacterium]|nr:hypothetical protein [Polyangiaceae bacterium]